jgi:hypothetical protein
MARFKSLTLLALLASLAGCATITESAQQVLLVQTVQDNREIGGVGCVVANSEGRWFVTSPGRVAITRSAGKLWVDCRKGEGSRGEDVVASKANTMAIVGNVVLTAGLGYLVDRRTGAGYDYPEVVTVIMHRPLGSVVPDNGDKPGNAVY